MADDALRLRPARVLPALLAAAVVALQIAYPLTHGDLRANLTIVIVVLLAATCVAHAAVTRGAATAVALLLVTAVPGYLVEVLGVHTGFPFGTYSYSARLGARVLGVPPLVGLAWTMLAWPAALAARRLVQHPAARIVVGGWALASADVFLDPQLVASGGWTWRFPSPHLPGVPDVPLANFGGWLLVALVLSAALQWLLRHDSGGRDGVALGLYLWTYAGSVVALGVFLDLRAAAGWGALGMGLVAIPLAWRLSR